MLSLTGDNIIRDNCTRPFREQQAVSIIATIGDRPAVGCPSVLLKPGLLELNTEQACFLGQGFDYFKHIFVISGHLGNDLLLASLC